MVKIKVFQDMIIECDYCESKVDANLIAKHSFFHADKYDTDGPPYEVYLLECTVCKQTLVAGQFVDFDGSPFTWSKISRIWPQPEKYISEEIPKQIGRSL